jgi:kynurenine formamidase
MGCENVSSDVGRFNGTRVAITVWPIKWQGSDDSMVRLVALVDEGDQ